MKEGKTGVDDAIKFMSEQEPLPALKWSDDLWKAANFHTGEINEVGSWDHDSKNGDSFSERISQFLTAEVASEAENLAIADEAEN